MSINRVIGEDWPAMAAINSVQASMVNYGLTQNGYPNFYNHLV